MQLGAPFKPFDLMPTRSSAGSAFRLPRLWRQHRAGRQIPISTTIGPSTPPATSA
ncbi:hypothetical protein M8494_11460 [Serratia ureilytica]